MAKINGITSIPVKIGGTEIKGMRILNYVTTLGNGPIA
jgi:hypothetical protein